MPAIETSAVADLAGQATRDLQLSEIRFRRLFETAKDGILIVNAGSGRIEEVNPFLIDLLGYSRAEFIGKFIWELGFLRDVAASKEKFVELQRQTYVRFEDLPLETVNGATIHVEFVSNVYREGDNEIIQCNIRDISARKLVEEQFNALLVLFRSIVKCNEVLVRETDELELCKRMCGVLIELAGIAFVCVGYSGDGGGPLTPFESAGSNGVARDELRKVWARADGAPGSADKAIVSLQTSICLDIATDPSAVADRAMAANAGFVSVAVFPLLTGAGLLGVLAVYANSSSTFETRAVELLQNLAGDIAYGIAAIRADAVARKVSARLARSFDRAVSAIAATVELRDPYTAGHQRRVASLASAIAVEMGLTKAEIEGLHMAAVVHDIGKIHVPIEILTSPAKLTDAEISIIRTHPRAGWDILKDIDFPWPIAEIVYQHHEKIDGSGYPRGLKGNAILVESRILAVADVVEAMSSQRPYRGALGVLPALQEISRHKGIHFDPAVVDACLRVFLAKDFDFPRA